MSFNVKARSKKITSVIDGFTVENFSYDEEFIRRAMIWISFFREYPFVFCQYYLNIHLKPFQCILLYEMMHNTNFVFIASRGLGKTWLTAIFCIVRCILYPGTKIVIAAGVKKQAFQVLEKINDIYKDSPMLREEIYYKSESVTDPRIEFKNGSSIITVASTDNARSLRANVLIMDEFRLINKDIADQVLRKFKSDPRHPKYLNFKKYYHLQESNIEILMTSAWQKTHWSYERYCSFLKQMLNGKPYYCCNLSYHVAIESGIKKMDDIINEMSEDDFDPIMWKVEMEGHFLGESQNAFFSGDVINGCRRLDTPIYPMSLQVACSKDARQMRVKKEDGEIRIVFADIALMSSKKHKNDNACIGIMRLLPNSSKNDYIRDVVYIETASGIHSETLALRIRKYFVEYECDFIVMDAGGIGMPIFDILVGHIMIDKDTGAEYEPLGCYNDDELHERSLMPNTPRVIYAFKGYGERNSEMAIYLQNAINNRKIRFLIDENSAMNDRIVRMNGYDEYSPETVSKLKMPYIQTSMAIYEMMNLDHERRDDGKIKVKEASGERKDRYSAIAMANYFATELSRKNFKKGTEIDDDDDIVYLLCD